MNNPVVPDNKSVTDALSPIPADNESSTKAPPEPDVQIANISQEPSGSRIIPATDSDELIGYYGKQVIVEGAVVELGSFRNVDVGHALVLYFSNAGQHMVSYEAWSKGMTGTDFRVIIREKDVPEFCYRCMYMNRRIAVTGKLDIYHGAPVIFVTDHSQITFIGTPPAVEPALSIVITRSTEIADNVTWYRYQGSIINNNTEWAVHDLYFGENKLADCIAPKGCPACAPLYEDRQNLMKEVRLIPCPNSIKFDQKFSADAVTWTGTDSSSNQVSIPPIRYIWKYLPLQQ